MSPLRRRSSRLRGGSVTPSKNTPSSRRLSSLAEGEETPRKSQSTLNSIGEDAMGPQTPATAPRIRPNFQEMHPGRNHSTASPSFDYRQAQTPATTGRIKPPFEEMHPGKGHSIASPSFDYRHTQTPATTGRIKPPFEEMHPGKGHSTASPSFDFRFARPVPQLGPEAQKMMEELREEALRIKTKLAAAREKEKRSEAEAEAEAAAMVGGRKIAMPKGKVGRFSDIHMADFKKMDSIAGHASAYRAQPGRYPHVTAPATKSLKRSQSHAKLDEREEVEKTISMTPLKTFRETDSDEGTPAKRARVIKDQAPVVDVASVTADPKTPMRLSRSRSILASLTTPTQASLARAHATQIPALLHSPSKQSLSAQRGMTKSATMGNLSAIRSSDSSQTFTQTPSRLDRMKSMLRRPGVTPDKSSLAIPVSKSPTKPNLDKELPSIPTTLAAAKMKNVNFTPRTINKHVAAVQASPSPQKSTILRSKSTMNIDDSVQYPSLSSVMDDPAKDVTYPDLSGVRHLPNFPQKRIGTVKPLPPSVPGTFTFRSDHTISFGTSPRGFGGSPGQSSVRQVRPSIFPGAMPGTFPVNAREYNKENTPDVLSIPHGIPNKKRHRANSDSDESEEEGDKRSPKKHKGSTGQESPMKPTASPLKLAVAKEKTAPKSRIPSPSKRGVLSLSRLNMLARPKMRK